MGVRRLRFVDPVRRVRVPGGHSRPRAVVTELLYPAQGAAGRGDLSGAPALPGGPRPLVVFAHGFAVEPDTYALLLRAWVSAGYVVAAPVFPRSNVHAPGGPDRNDLANQPGDMRLVISGLVAAGRVAAGPLRGLVDPRRIAVAGHSDGGITALATAFDRRARDRRVSAAVILAGAWLRGYSWVAGPGSPALLAVQGTADHTNDPSNASAYFALAAPPKYLLWLLGADHLPPFTRQQPQLAIVERATTAFLDRYLKGNGGGERRLLAAGRSPGRAQLFARP